MVYTFTNSDRVDRTVDNQRLRREGRGLGIGLSGQRLRRLGVVLAVVTLVGGAGTAVAAGGQAAASSATPSMTNSIVPEPAVVQPSHQRFRITPDTMIFTQAGSDQAAAIGDQRA